MGWDEAKNILIQNGKTESEIQLYAQGLAQHMVESGNTPEQFEEYFGKPKEPDPGKMSEFFNTEFKRNMPNEDPVKEAEDTNTYSTAIKAAWQGSIVGLGVRHGLPDTQLEEPSLFFEGASTAKRAVQGATQFALDSPAMIGGAILGSAAGPAGVIMGAFALPEAMRSALIQGYESGGVHSSKDFMDVVDAGFVGAIRGGLTGDVLALTGGAGKLATAGLPGPMASAANIALETGALTGVGSALEGRLPEKHELLDNAILIGGFHLFAPIKQKLGTIFSDTGLHPADVGAATVNNEVLKQEMLGVSNETPPSLAPLKQPKVSSDFVPIDGKLVRADKAAEQGEFNFRGTPAQFVETVSSKFTPEKRLEAAKAHDPAAFKALEEMSAEVKSNTAKIAENEAEIKRLAPSKELAKELADVQSKLNSPDTTRDEFYELTERETELLKESKMHEENANRSDSLRNNNLLLQQRIDKIGANSTIKERIARAYEKGQASLKRNLKDRIVNAHIELPEIPETKVQDIFNPEFTEQGDHNPILSESAKLELIREEQLDLFPGTDFSTGEEILLHALQDHPELANVIAPELVEATPSTEKEPTLKISFRPKNEGDKTSLGSMVRDVYNDQHFSKMLSEDTSKLIGDFPISAQPDVQVIKSRAHGVRAQTMIGVEGEKANSPYGVYDPKTGKKISDSLVKIIEDGVPRKLRDEFRKFLIYSHVLDLNKEGQLTGVDNAEAQSFVDKNRALFSDTQKKVVAWNNAILQYMVDGDLLTEKLKNELVEKYPNYASTNRLTKDLKAKGGAKKSRALYSREGSELPFLDPIRSAMEKAVNAARLVEENQAKLAMVAQNELRPEGFKFLEPVRMKGEASPLDNISVLEDKDYSKKMDTRHNLTDSQIGYFDKGEYKVFDIRDPELKKTLEFKGYDSSILNALSFWGAPLKLAASLSRAGISGGADFIVRHIMRSEIFTSMVSENNRAPFLGTMVQAANALLKNKEFNALKVEAMLTGALDGVGSDINRTILTNKNFVMVDKEGMLGRTHNVIKNMAGVFHKLLTVTEELKRLSVYKDLVEKAGPNATWADKLEAGWQTSNSTVHGLKIGAKMQGLNMITAFMHYEVQGLGKTVEAWRNDPKRMAVRAGMMTAISALLWYAGKDDEDIQNLPQYQKNLFWNIKVGGEIVKIAKPWEQGVIFGSIPERVFDLMYQDNPRALDGLATTLLEMIPLHPPTGISQWYALSNNFNSMTDRSIIPQRMLDPASRIAPEQRVAIYTSEVAKKIAGALSHVPGAAHLNLDAPIMVDYAINMWTGQAGRMAVQGMDALMRKLNLAPASSKPAWELADVPFIGGLISRHPTYNAQPLKDLHDEMDKITESKNTYESYKKSNDWGKAAEYQEKHPEVIYYESAKAAYDMVQEQGKMVHEITITPSEIMSASDKKQTLENLWKVMISTSRTSLKQIDLHKKGMVR